MVTSLTEFRNTASEVRLVVPLGPACLGLSSAAAAASSRACDPQEHASLMLSAPHVSAVRGPDLVPGPPRISWEAAVPSLSCHALVPRNTLPLCVAAFSRPLCCRLPKHLPSHANQQGAV